VCHGYVCVQDGSKFSAVPAAKDRSRQHRSRSTWDLVSRSIGPISLPVSRHLPCFGRKNGELIASLGADFGDLKKFRTVVSEITENMSFGRLFRMAALRKRCNLRRRNGKPNPLFALQLRCITGQSSFVFSLYFSLFYPFILAQLLLQLTIKATLVLFFALFTCARLGGRARAGATRNGPRRSPCIARGESARR